MHRPPALILVSVTIDTYSGFKILNKNHGLIIRLTMADSGILFVCRIMQQEVALSANPRVEGQ